MTTEQVRPSDVVFEHHIEDDYDDETVMMVVVVVVVPRWASTMVLPLKVVPEHRSGDDDGATVMVKYGAGRKMKPG